MHCVFSFDSFESVDSQWVILYMYDPYTLYMNNVGCGRLVERHRGSYTSGHFIWNLWNEPFKLDFVAF